MTKQAKSQTQINNDRVTVTLWRFAPGEETGHHRHGHDYVIVPLTDGRLRADSADGTGFFDMKMGESYARPKGVEHNIINAGDDACSFIEIELKQ